MVEVRKLIAEVTYKEKTQYYFLTEVIGGKEGLLAFSVAIGLRTMRALMEEEVTEGVGPRGRHTKNRQAYRHGHEPGEVVLGGRKIGIERPRARSLSGEELVLETYQLFQNEDLLDEAALERMLHGLSCRRYQHGLEPVGADLDTGSISKSEISRRFVERTKTAVNEILARPLGDLKVVALFIDGILLADHTVVAALGLCDDGRKHVLGLWEGATENATICRHLLSDLVDRGLKVDQGLMVVMAARRRCGRLSGTSLASKLRSKGVRSTSSATYLSTCQSRSRTGPNGNFTTLGTWMMRAKPNRSYGPWLAGWPVAFRRPTGSSPRSRWFATKHAT